jgi:hypothetical protein
LALPYVHTHIYIYYINLSIKLYLSGPDVGRLGDVVELAEDGGLGRAVRHLEAHLFYGVLFICGYLYTYVCVFVCVNVYILPPPIHPPIHTDLDYK